jgi:hypothetical protein
VDSVAPPEAVPPCGHVVVDNDVTTVMARDVGLPPAVATESVGGLLLRAVALWLATRTDRVQAQVSRADEGTMAVEVRQARAILSRRGVATARCPACGALFPARLGVLGGNRYCPACGRPLGEAPRRAER